MAAKKLSRQARWQQKHKRLGLCHSCKKKALDESIFCDDHLVRSREYYRAKLKAKRRYRNALSYKLKKKAA